jgi:hypothetical protein
MLSSIQEISTFFLLCMEVLLTGIEFFRSALADIHSSVGGIVFFDLVMQLSSLPTRILMKDFHRKNRRRYVHMNFSYLQGHQAARVILIL